MTIVNPHSIRAILAEPAFGEFPSQPEEIADVAMLKERPWAFVVLATLAEIYEMAAAGATTEELHARTLANISAAEQRLAGAPLYWGQA